MLFNIAKSGVYPIAYNDKGELLCDFGLPYPKNPGTLINEGRKFGQIALYVKFHTCNLYCSWVNYDNTGDNCKIKYCESEQISLLTFLKLIKRNTKDITNIVITGGEPLNHLDDLKIILYHLNKLRKYIILETNGTIYDETVSKYVNYLSISPKLSTSIPWEKNLNGTDIPYIKTYALMHDKIRKNLKVIQAYIDDCHKYPDKDFELKFQVSCPFDISELKTEFVDRLYNVLDQNVTLIAQGSTSEQYRYTSQIAIDAAIENNWFFSPRIYPQLVDKLN